MDQGTGDSDNKAMFTIKIKYISKILDEKQYFIKLIIKKKI